MYQKAGIHSVPGTKILNNTNLRGANLDIAWMMMANLEGALVKGLILDGADLESTRLTQLKHGDKIIGLDTAKNLDSVIKD